MRKLVAIGLALCIFTVLVSSASAWGSPTPVKYTAKSTIQQFDTAGYNKIVQGSEATGTAYSSPTFWGSTHAGVDISQIQTGSVDSYKADAFQQTIVNAQGDNPSAQSTQSTEIHVGTDCTTNGGCTPDLE